MKKKQKNALTEYVKANRKGSREAEIEMYGHPINHHRVWVSKKVYNRSQMKRLSRNDHGDSLLFLMPSLTGCFSLPA